MFVRTLLLAACILIPTTSYSAEPKEKSITLMGLLEPYLYPKAEFDGATMQDAGIKGIGSIKAHAKLTTTDPAEKVIAHYFKQFNLNEDGKPKDVDPETKPERTVHMVNDSKDRPLTLCIFVINGERRSDTLTITQVEGEQETHIQWMNFTKLWPK